MILNKVSQWSYIFTKYDVGIVAYYEISVLKEKRIELGQNLNK